MSSEGLKAAAAHAQQLPVYTSLGEAQTDLLNKNAARIADLLSDARSSQAGLDFSVDSLLRLERWYFERAGSQAQPPADPQQLAEGCAFYFGEVVTRTVPGATWIVSEFPFERGRFEIGVRQAERGVTMMLSSFHRKLNHPLNKKRDALWRTYHHYFVRNSGISIRF
jgi:hypothetical protein